MKIEGIDGDTLLADYLLSPDRRSHKLDDLALVHLEHRMITFADTVAKGQTFADVPLEPARDYAAEDAHVTWLLDQRLGPLLVEEGLDELYRTLELPLIPVLARMELAGIAVDTDLLAELSEELAKEIATAELACWDLAGEEFKIGSVKELRELLFERLGAAGGQENQDRALHRRVGPHRAGVCSTRCPAPSSITAPWSSSKTPMSTRCPP